MSTPPNPYNRSYNFEDFQSINPNSPLPAQHLENELNNIEETLDKTVSRLAEIQNADGSIKITGNIEQNITNTATSVATSVANEVAADYLAANFDATAATTATTAAQAAASSATQSASSAHLAGLHANYAEQAALAAQGSATQAASYRNSAEDFADQANLSKIAAHGSAQSAAANAAEVGNIYNSALSLKNWVDSESFQFLHKREDMADAGAIMLFNGGEAQNTLIGKIFQGASVSADSSVEYRPPTSGTSPGNMDIFSGPWWVEGHDSPEDPHKIVMRDMFSCLADTWLTFGPRSTPWQGVEGNIKPRQEGVNGVPNGSFHIGPERIRGVNYTKENFNIGLTMGSSPLTPKSYVDEADTSLSVRIDQKANKSGDTFTGKVNMTPTATTASLNLGSQQNSPSSTIAGDIWIGANINYRSFDGISKMVANTNTTNQFTQAQAISINSTSNALRINQTGTGHALVVEDSTSPDATPFIIDANGRVGIGGAPDAVAALKVDAGGVKFGDGTTLTTANHNHTISEVSGLQDAINAARLQEYDNFKIYNTNDLVLADNRIFKFNNFVGAAGYGPITHPSYWTEQSAQAQANLSAYARLDGATFTGKVNFNAPGTGAKLNIGIGGTDAGSTSPGDIWIATGGTLLNYRDATGSWRQVLTTTQVGTIDVSSSTIPALRITQRGTGEALRVEDSTTPDATSFIVGNDGKVGIGVNSINSLYTLDVSGSASRINSYLEVTGSVDLKNGISHTGTIAVFCGNSDYTNNVSFCDGVWAGGGNQGKTFTFASQNKANADVNFTVGSFNSINTSDIRLYGTLTAYSPVFYMEGAQRIFSQPNTGFPDNHALHIINTTNKYSLMIEDSFPDSTKLIVDADGNLGVGVNTGFTPTQKVEVVGNIKADGFVSGSGPVFKVNSVDTHANGANTHDILMSVNGSTYRIPAIFVSTP